MTMCFTWNTHPSAALMAGRFEKREPWGARARNVVLPGPMILVC